MGDTATLPLFLRIPVEIRLQIYDHCFIHGPLTIAGCALPPWWPTEFNSARCDIPGMARNHLPVARVGFDRPLLEGRPNIKDCSWVSSSYKERHRARASETSEMNQWTALSSNPSRDGQKSSLKSPAWMLPARCSPSSEPPLVLHPTIPSLHLTCHQIHQELVRFRSLNSAGGSKAARNLDMYVSYPEGICAVAHRYMHLLDQARTVNVAGITFLKSPLSYNPEGSWNTPSHQKRTLQEEQVEALARVVARVNLTSRASPLTATDCPPQATSFIESPAKPRYSYEPGPRPTLDLRIFYHSRYSSLPPMQHLIATSARRTSPAAAAFAALHHQNSPPPAADTSNASAASAPAHTWPQKPRGDIRVGMTDAGHAVLLQILAAPAASPVLGPEESSPCSGDAKGDVDGEPKGSVAFLRPVIIPNMVARAAYSDEDWFRRVSIPHEWECCELERERADDALVEDSLPPVYYT